jgi:AcrR family transcriptional regulator
VSTPVELARGMKIQAATRAAGRQVPVEMAGRLQQAADGLLSSFDDLQMTDIAAAAGVARSSLYYYFAGREDVLSFLLQSTLETLTDTIAAAATSPGDPATRLRAVLRAHLQHLNDHPAATRLLVANLGRAGRLREIAAAVTESVEEPVRKLLAEGAHDGSLRAQPDAELAATGLVGAVLIVGMRALVVEGSVDIDRVTELLHPMLWRGLAPE